MNKESKNEEARYEGVNWDSEWKPKVKMKCAGDNQPKRKVLTKGNREVYCDLGKIRKLLRQGYEVRLCEPGGECFLRIYPYLGTDLKTMYAVSKSMTPLSRCLADKKVRVVFPWQGVHQPRRRRCGVRRNALPPRGRGRERYGRGA